MGVVSLFAMYREGNTFMVALEKDEAGVVSDDLISKMRNYVLYWNDCGAIEIVHLSLGGQKRALVYCYVHVMKTG